MQIRPAVTDDLEQISELFNQYRTFYGAAPDIALAHKFIGARMQHGESVILVAQATSDELGGFTQLYPGFSSISAARVFTLNDLFVSPAYRRQGMARALLEAAREFAHEAGALQLSLATATNNHAAQALYQSLGWEKDQGFHHFSLTVAAN